MNAKWRNSFGTGNAGRQTCAPGRAMSRLAKLFVLLVSLIGLATWGGNATAATITQNQWVTPLIWIFRTCCTVDIEGDG
jgi:hypothetical protein